MKQSYTFTISGMTCHACEQLITMDLEDAGLPKPESIDHAAGTMRITLIEEQVNRVKDVISATNKYTVTSVELL